MQGKKILHEKFFGVRWQLEKNKMQGKGNFRIKAEVRLFEKIYSNERCDKRKTISLKVIPILMTVFGVIIGLAKLIF